MWPSLMLPLALLGGGQTPPPSVPLPVVGAQVLLTDTTYTVSNVERMTPFLTDAQGHGVPRSPWLNRPLEVLRETPSAYLLSSGPAQVWLPKRNLQAKAVFPLVRVQDGDPLVRALDEQAVFLNGQPLFQCEIVPGYHALVTIGTARIEGVWRVVGDRLNIGPQGGFVSGEGERGQRISRDAVLIMLRPLSGVRALGAMILSPSLADRSSALMTQAPQRCTRLPAVYASADDIQRNLTTVPLPARPLLPADPAAAQRALIGWTRPQVLAQYGSPNEAGSLADLMKLGIWTFGYDYGFVSITFGPDGRVRQAQIARSP